jgi:hypothetical protein
MGTKTELMRDPNSCLGKAADDEPVFLLRAHDVAAPAVIEYWVGKRIALNKNAPDDPKIIESLDIANKMREWQARERNKLRIG